jgi:predicted MPP superfamily phosphohydrolase
MKLVQTSDLHLGRRRLDGRLPDSDLAEAFAFIAEQAILERADALLLAGDCFDKPQVEPPHLRQAQRVLERLKGAGIPVIAIEGNHDKAFVHSDAPTWVHYLAEDGLLTLLRTPFDADGPCLAPWDPATRTGAYLDLGGVRFVGAGYLGAATPHKVREIAARLEDRAHVLLLHAGPDYFVGEGGGFSGEDLKAVHRKVQYLALGHIHKPMVHGGWACNAGSPENCDLREAAYDLDRDGAPAGRGYAVVQLDPLNRDCPVALTVHSNPRRPVHRLVLDCTPFGNKLKDGAAALVRAAVAQIRSAGAGADAVIDLKLIGRLNLTRIALDQAMAATEIEQAALVTAVAMDSTGLNLEGAALPGLDRPDAPTREQLERAAILQLVGGRNLFGLEGLEPEFAALFYELKEGVRTGWGADELAEHLARSPLVDRILAAREVNP